MLFIKQNIIVIVRNDANLYNMLNTSSIIFLYLEIKIVVMKNGNISHINTVISTFLILQDESIDYIEYLERIIDHFRKHEWSMIR